MVLRFIKLIILVPVAAALIVLSVANRHAVTVALNPFRPEDQVMSFSIPLFGLVLAALILGVLIGSFATWVAQGRHRRRARQEADEARKWREEADRQRTRIEQVTTRNLLTASK